MTSDVYFHRCFRAQAETWFERLNFWFPSLCKQESQHLFDSITNISDLIREVLLFTFYTAVTISNVAGMLLRKCNKTWYVKIIVVLNEMLSTLLIQKYVHSVIGVLHLARLLWNLARSSRTSAFNRFRCKNTSSIVQLSCHHLEGVNSYASKCIFHVWLPQYIDKGLPSNR